MTDSVHENLGENRALQRFIAGARRRRRARCVLEGSAAAFAVILVAALIAIGVMDATHFDAGVVSIARNGVYVMAAIALLIAVAARALKRSTDIGMARYLETHAPHLDAMLLTAVEAGANGHTRSTPKEATSPVLARRLVERALASGEHAGLTGVEGGRMRRAGVALLAVLGLGLLLGLFGPDPLRHGMDLLLRPAHDPALGNPYAIHVSPGDASVLQGDDQRIAATTQGFLPDRLELVSRSGADAPWVRTKMPAAADPGAFETFLFNVENAREYYVAGANVRSPTYRIEVMSRPSVERIDLQYEFPARTGRAPELVIDGGDISAVHGTRVEVRVVPSQPVRAGRLVLDGERSVALREVDGTLRATLEIHSDGHYRVELPTGAHMAPASREHAIVALADRMPSVAVRWPGRDLRATRVEEVEFEISAEDDVAVGAIELVLSFNGGADEIVTLGNANAPQPAVTDRHTLYLEERELAPGDLIAYYVRARDTSDDGSRQVSSDMFFIDVRPFDQSFRSEDGGGGGGGANSRGGPTLSAQQRSLVVAMFNTNRDRHLLDVNVYAETLDTLGDAQLRIRERVDAIVRRLGRRSIVELNPGYRRMAEELPKASRAMLKANAQLAVQSLSDALPAAREALLHLQRADAAFRDVHVAQGRAGAVSDADDLANLFRLEMDKFRNQYADVQRGQWQAQSRELDETLRKLRELARRQQREIERAPRRAERGENGAQSQAALAEEIDEMVRRLERLSRQRDSQALQGSLNELKAAARAMRQAADRGDAAAGGDALERLQRARRLLDAERPRRLADGVENALRRAQSMVDEQRSIRGDRNDTIGAGGTDQAQAARLDRRKEALAREVRGLESSLERLASDARREAKASARAGQILTEAVDQLKNGQIAERIERSRHRLDEDSAAQARQVEDGIARDLEASRDRIAAALDAVSGGEQTRLGAARDRLRTAIRGLDAWRERLTERARRRPRLGTGGASMDLDAADLADLRGTLHDQWQRLQSLADEFTDSGHIAQNIEALLRAMRETVEDGDATDAQTLAARHAALVAALKGIERDLRGEHLAREAPALIAPRRAEPEPEQRAIVETYYRNLSEGATR